ncbi:MAG: hypothetical protein K0Q61_3592, partial [Rhodococcus erythropolis]|nr:hypothetical protein [Rhodococcus erythropolis]
LFEIHSAKSGTLVRIFDLDAYLVSELGSFTSSNSFKISIQRSRPVQPVEQESDEQPIS